MGAVRLDVKKRLLYSKYLLRRARTAQRERGDLGFAISLLLMHDAAEMVMLSVLDVLNIKGKNQDFMQFWKTVEEHDKSAGNVGKAPPSRTAMDGLNKARVALKHHGIIPNRSVVRDFLPRVESFCERIVDTYLGLDLSELSLADLIENDEARKLLGQAERDFAGGNKRVAVSNMRLAFDTLERALPPDLQPIVQNSIMYCEESDAVHQLANAVNVLSIGVDPLRYRLFLKNTPWLTYSATGEPSIFHHRSFDDMSEPTFETCVEFVVDYALHTSQLFQADSV